MTQEEIAKIIFNLAVGQSQWGNPFYADEREGSLNTAEAIASALAAARPDREGLAGLADYLAYSLKMNEAIAHIPEMAEHRAKIARWEAAVRRLSSCEQE